MSAAGGLPDAVDLELAREVAQQLDDDELPIRASALRACIGSAQALPLALEALRALTNGYKYSTEVVTIARNAIAAAEGRA